MFERSSNDRRRRMLNDETIAGTSEPGQTSSRRAASIAARQAEKYTDAANIEQQSRLVDFIPTRFLWLSIWTLAGLTIVGGLEAAHFYLRPMLEPLLSARTAPIDLEASGSLASWFCSALLLLAAAVSLINYSLRRHRLDDYKGRYRVWLWAAMALVAMSIDETTGVRLVLRDIAIHLAKTSLYDDGAAWWIAAWGAVISIVGIRLMFDVKESRGSLFVLLLAGALWTTAAVTQLKLLSIDPSHAVMMTAGCRMAAYLFVLLGITLNARYLILDVQGLIPARLPTIKPLKQKADSSSETGPTVVKLDSSRRSAKQPEKRTDLDPVPAAIKMPEKPSQSAKNPPSSPQQTQNDEFDDEEMLEPSGGHRKLSRADRKRMRKDRDEHRKAG